MIDAVDRLIDERQALDRGFQAAAVVSIAGHVAVAIGALVLPALIPKEPLLKAGTVFAIPLPRGGGGQPSEAPPAPANQPQAREEAPPPEKAASKVLKPPKEEKRVGLPDPNAKKTADRKKPEPVAAPRAAGAPGGTGSTNATPGLSIGPAGPGTPDGTGTGGDWYLAGVQQRIWTIWVGQIKPDTPNPAIVAFTILADGSLTDVHLVQSSGITMVDMAAQRAVQSAGPFAPLPRDYGTNRFTIQAVFKPSPR